MSSTAQAVRHVHGVLERLGLLGRQLLLAVSGGADSMALAYIVSRAAGPEHCRAATVDHGFRAESAGEASDVARCMRAIGIRHETRVLRWGSLPPPQRLEETARQRRYAELDSICREHGIRAVLTGHHAGDQAETFLLRFLRQSGVYGLAGMAEQAPLPAAAPFQPGDVLDGEARRPVVVRPLLALDKAAIYGICRAQGIPWHEDASNSDGRFRRNELRRAMSAAAMAGAAQSPLDATALLDVCRAMQGHRSFIDRAVAGLLADQAVLHAGLGVAELAAAPGGGQRLPRWAHNAALRERVLASAVGWVGCKDRAPELAHLRRLEQAVAAFYSGGRAAPVTAAGVTLLPPTGGHGWLLCRQSPRAGEIAPRLGLPVGAAALWDGRLAVRVRWRPGRAPGAAHTWCIHSLRDAMQRWRDAISEHRSALRRDARGVERLSAVRAAQPVVVVGPRLAFALGRSVAGSPVDVHVRAWRPTAAPGADDAFAW